MIITLGTLTILIIGYAGAHKMCLILRKIYLHGPIGINDLRKAFGGGNNRSYRNDSVMIRICSLWYAIIIGIIFPKIFKLINKL